MTLRKRGIEPQDQRRRLDGHITPENPTEDEVAALSSDVANAWDLFDGDGKPASAADPAEPEV